MQNKILIGVAVLALVILGFWLYGPFGMPPMGKTLTPAEKLVCGITAEVTEGPYYVSGTPLLVNGNLNYDNLEGDTLAVSGFVYEGLDDTKPLTNAKVYIWQTDAVGKYHPNNNGAMSSYDRSEVSLRGYVVTDNKGAYTFKTIYPGEYSGRARHIHIKIQADGFKELTSQLLFALPGDALEFDEDTVSKGLPNCHLLSHGATGPKDKPTSATFNFRLQK
jgi:protocatechuate 3,4-dioxygenase beta subunit